MSLIDIQFNDLRTRLAAAEAARDEWREIAKANLRVATRDREAVETLKERVLAFCENKMHRGWHGDLRKLLEEKP